MNRTDLPEGILRAIKNESWGQDTINDIVDFELLDETDNGAHFYVVGHEYEPFWVVEGETGESFLYRGEDEAKEAWNK